MKRIMIGLLLLFPLAVYSQTMSFRIFVGIFPQTEMVGTWQNPSNYFSLGDKTADMVGTGGDRPSSMDVGAELGIHFSPYIGLAVGFGYMNLGLKSNGEVFTHPAGSEIIGDFSFSPRYKSNIYSAYTSVILTWPWRNGLNLNLFAGAGYYIGNVHCYDSRWTKASPVWLEHFSYASWVMESKVSTIGYHAGISLELRLSSRSFIVLDGTYRKIEFTEFSSKPLRGNQSEWDQIVIADSYGLAGDSTFVYAQLVKGDTNLGDILFNGQSLKLTGFGWHLGLKFTF